MSPSSVNPHSSILNPVTTLKGVGAATAKRLEKLNIHSIQDLLFHLPYRYQDRTHITPIAALKPGDFAVIEGIIEITVLKQERRRSLICYVNDGTGHLVLRFFYFHPQLQHCLKQGEKIRCFGEIHLRKLGLEIIHPEFQIMNENVPIDQTLTPIYSTTEGLSQVIFRKLMQQALQVLTKNPTLMPEILPQEIMQQNNLMNLTQAIFYLQQPPQDASQDLLQEGVHPAQQRIALEELLAHQLSLLQMRAHIKAKKAHALKKADDLTTVFLQKLPFKLTTAQQRVSAEIQKDVEQTIPMLRLIQGDVGSGKTIIAALAALQAIGSGYQVALMAPTELLAEQHFYNFKQWLSPMGITIGLLTAKLSGKAQEKFLKELSEKKIQLIIGTHALFQERVIFSQLALIIIDEQHRFGVEQRLMLREKGSQHDSYPHQLMMTATPIPRTLAMTAYADLDCSVIDEMPPGRSPVNTAVISQTRRTEIISRVLSHCRAGKQVYWVCTLIAESEVLQCQAAESTYEILLQSLPELRLGLIHGRLKTIDKEKIMRAFKNLEIDLLVATTVIEVGVDVSNASLMVIENPERLGLAQLHQLRGRVGRGNTQSHCVLLYQSPLSQLAKQRLEIIRQTCDGFKIAEADLKLRGPGEMLGTRQAGLLQMKIANLQRDNILLIKAQQIAKTLQKNHPHCIDLLLQRWLGSKHHFREV